MARVPSGSGLGADRAPPPPPPSPAAALLADLRARGVRLRAGGGRAKWAAHGCRLGIADVLAIKRHEDEIVALLGAEPPPIEKEI